jgi:hypothetical protein
VPNAINPCPGIKALRALAGKDLGKLRFRSIPAPARSPPPIPPVRRLGIAAETGDA